MIDPRHGRVALLTNFIAPYRIPVFAALSKRLTAFRVLVSTRMEANRSWPADRGEIDAVVQRSFTFPRSWKHPSGFVETVYTHFPYDTIAQLRRFRPDVVISGEFGFRTLNAALFCLLFPRTRLVVWATISETTEERRSAFRLALRRRLLSIADAAMTNGRSGVRYLIGIGADPKKLFIVPQTVDVRRWAEIPLHREKSAARRLLFAGQLVSRKGLAPFLGILAAWCREHSDLAVELRIAGDGPERAPVESVPTPPNLAVEILGNIAYDDLPTVYSDAGMLVLPTYADEWGLVINEGLAAGLPVLGSLYAQAVQDLIEEGHNGWTFRIDKPDEVRRALDEAFRTSDQRLDLMRRNARATALRLPPEEIADRMVAAIEYALQPAG